jgi:hypothetical protein
MKRLSLLALSLLVACGTPQEQCIARNTRDLRTVEALIAETEGNLRRGYGFRTEPRVDTVYEPCLPPPPPADGTDPVPPPVVAPRLCPRIETTEVRVPVALDLAAEARKLDQLRAKRAELQRSAEAVIAQCRAEFPE